MNQKFKVYISSSLLESERWIENFLLESFQVNYQIEEYVNYNRALVSFCILDTNDAKNFSQEELAFEFKGPNLTLFEESTKNIKRFQDLEELKALKSEIWDLTERIINSNLEMIYKLSNINIKKVNYEEILIDDYESLKGLYEQLAALHSLEDIEKYIKENLPSHGIVSLEKISQEDLVKSIYLLDETKKVFLISDNELDSFGICLYSFIKQAIDKFDIIKSNLKTNYFDQIFNHLPFAIAIYDEAKEIYSHNSEFSKLGVTTRELLALKNNQSLDLGDLGKFKIVITELDSSYTQVSFVLIDNFSSGFSNQSQEELGIVSSSIAHELNNPLGGILAALDVLLLDELAPELSDKFNQMKEGVFRCKELVETFLAFSRKRQVNSQDQKSIKEILDQVSRLTRFRLIENNYQINIELVIQDHLIAAYNSHLLTMIIYLFYGEVLTSLSKESLIQNKVSSAINIKVVEDKMKVTFELGAPFRISDEFLKSKLFNHILDLLGVKVKLSEKLFTLAFYK